MCGIIGIIGDKDAGEKVKKCLTLMQYRGSDGAGISDGKDVFYADTPSELPAVKGDIAFGHVLHSIIGRVLQPLKNFDNSFFIANAEIYNWKELKEQHELDGVNDTEVMQSLFHTFSFHHHQDLLEGVYAFASINKHRIILSRDILGVKPLWYSLTSDAFVFSSEKKVLETLGYDDVKELNPRHILTYHMDTKKIIIDNKPFFDYEPEHQNSTEELQDSTTKLLSEAIDKRIPKKKFGLLFSGGIDSVFLAKHFKDRGLDFTCYTAVLDTKHTPPTDLVASQKAAQELGLTLKIKKILQEDIPQYLKTVVPLIEDSNVVKASVALTFFVACEMAKEDGCKVIFSGLGSEEIFAGYDRHKKSENSNKECIAGLRKMYERDLYRDDVITMYNSLELRLPFLDKNLVEYAVKIPDKYKIVDDRTKVILRSIALKKGVPERLALRKKKAAQYGSRFDHAIGKLAKSEGMGKSDYLRQFRPSHNLKLGVLFSGGKDSTYAAWIMQRQGYKLSCLITMKSYNPSSYMFHTPSIDLTPLQAKAMSLPLIVQETSGVKEEELDDLRKALESAKEDYKIDGIISGAVFSTYQRDRIDKLCDSIGLKIFSPLWHKPQDNVMKELLDNSFSFVFSAIAADGLDESWLGKIITTTEFDILQKLHERNGMHIAGEGGEFESFVLDCPLFKKKIVIESFNKDMENEYTGKIVIKESKLVEK